ncbi:MAG: putative glyoxalase superfamily protein PhnB [Halioglobus sp.]
MVLVDKELDAHKSLKYLQLNPAGRILTFPISKLGCYKSQTTPTKWVSKHKRKVISQSLYVIVEDVEGRYAMACSQGAITEQVPEKQSYGGRLYLCRCFERNLCIFGDYNPWQNC